MVLTPKLRFQENVPATRAHRELVVNDAFRAAVEASLVQMVYSLPTVRDPADAAAQYNRIMGARDFIQTLLNIAEQTPKVPDKMPANLDHTLK